MLKLSTGLLLLTLISNQVFATFSFNQNCAKAYEYIIGLQFKEAKKIIEKEREINPKNNIPHLLENQIDFLTAFISEEQADFKRLINNKEKRLEILSRDDFSSPYYLYIQAEIHLHSAFTRFKFREYLSSAYEIHKAYKLLEENAKKFPDFKPNLKNLGLLHAMLGAVPEEYKWLINITGMNGTIQQGVSELRQVIASDNHSYLTDEVLIILTFIQLNLQNPEKEINKILDNINRMQNKNGLLVTLTQANAFMKTGNNSKAIDILLEGKPQLLNNFPLYYLDYLTGVAKLHRLDQDADAYFLRFLSGFKGKNYIKAAYQKLAWCYLVKGDTKRYKEYISYCKTEGSNFIDEDKQALKEAEIGHIPNLILLKARLLFDGGYYPKAIAQIANKPISSFPILKDQIEVTYRLGRIYDKIGDSEKAIEYYKQTFANGSGYSYYFAANASLFLGLLYENRGQYEKARFYFKECLSLRNHEYQNSIDQKAEAGLNRLKI